jgi:hypothetical protein
MEFRVPQFIDVEDKIVGDFSFAQIVYLVGGTFISYVLWKSLPLYISILLIGGIMSLSIALAFYPKDKYGKSFIGLMEAAFHFFFTNPRLYTWKRIVKMPKVEEKKKRENTISVTVPSISDSALKSLSWGLDVKRNV